MAEKEHIVAAFRFELSKLEVPAIRQRMVDNLAHVDEKLARRVAEPLGIGAPDAKAAAGRPGFRDHRMTLALEESPALRMADTGDGSVKTRKIAILAADGVDSASLKPIREALEAAGAQCKVIGPRLGTVASASKRQIEIDATFAAMPSIMFDAVLIPAGKDGVAALRQNGEALHFALEAFKHCKAICAVGEGVELLSLVGVSRDSAAAPAGVGGRDAGDESGRHDGGDADRDRRSSPRLRSIAIGIARTSTPSRPEAEVHPRSACGASPSRGRYQRPGEAGSAVSLGFLWSPGLGCCELAIPLLADDRGVGTQERVRKSNRW
jgi:hypothetical protein